MISYDKGYDELLVIAFYCFFESCDDPPQYGPISTLQGESARVPTGAALVISRLRRKSQLPQQKAIGISSAFNKVRLQETNRSFRLRNIS